jgi:protein TonB
VQTIGNPSVSQGRDIKPILGSILVHVVVLALLAGALHRGARWVAPYRLPGSERGTNLVVSYLPGRAPAPSAVKATTEPKLTAPEAMLAKQLKRKPEAVMSSNAPSSASAQVSMNGADALGSGEISIALTTYFPPPKPDLSVLPRGTKGDVILDVVIDTNGKISNVKMMTGLGYGIDELVIATVQQWTFRPATQNGHPVASEQELHFHYERG